LRVLIAIGLHTAFEKPLVTGVWRPTGTPALAKLIETLDQADQEPEVFFLGKRPEQLRDFGHSGPLRLEGLTTRPRYIPPLRRLTWPLNRIRWYLNEAWQVWAVLRTYRTFKPDVIYFDRANVVIAALFASVTRTPVVFRLLGMHPTMYAVTDGRRPYYALMRWAYRSPFACVICSQDGSGAEGWLDRLFAPGVPQHLMLNGVDPLDRNVNEHLLPGVPRDKTVVTFLGRLEKEKGGEEFVAGFLRALAVERDGLHAVIIGDGSRAESMRHTVAAAGAADAVTFAGAISHDHVLGALRNTDIYVSLNRFGNLSNANLEAMRAACCMIFPRSQPDIGTDLATDQMLPPETILRIPSSHDVEALAEAIVHLHRNPAERQSRARATERVAKGFTRTWAERMAAEMRILEKLAGRAGRAP